MRGRRSVGAIGAVLVMLVLGGMPSAQASEVVEGPAVAEVLEALDGTPVLVATMDGGLWEGTLFAWDDDTISIRTPDGRMATLDRLRVVSVRGIVQPEATAVSSHDPTPAPGASGGLASTGPEVPVDTEPSPSEAVTPLPHPQPAPVAGRIERLPDGTWRIGGVDVDGFDVEDALRADPRAEGLVRSARTKTIAGAACVGSGALLVFGGILFAAGEARGDVPPVGGLVTSMTGLAVAAGAGMPLLFSARGDRRAAVLATGGIMADRDGFDARLMVMF